MRTVILSVLFLTVLLPASGQDQALASLYLREALSASAQGDWEALSVLASQSLEFDPWNADARTLLGEFFWYKKDFSQAEREAKMALSSNTFQEVSPSRAKKVLASVYLRMKKYQEVESLLVGDPTLALHPDLLLLAAEAIDRRGPEERSLAFLKQADLYQPFSDLFLPLMLRYPDQFPALDKRLRKNKTEGRGFTLPLLDQIAWRLGTTEPRKRWALSQLRALGYESPELNLQAYLVGEAGHQQYVAALNLIGPGQDYDSLLLCFQKKTPEEQKDLAAYFQSYSGTMLWDKDRDGIAEGELVWEKGQLVQTREDREQDGQWDFYVDYSSSGPRAFREITAHTTFSVVYEEYPWVGSFSLLRSSSRDVYSPPPFALDWTLFEQKAPDLPDFYRPGWRVWKTDPWTWQKIIASSSRLESFDTAGRLFRRSYLASGQEYFREEDTNLDGRLDKALLFLEGGLSKAWTDLDGDGKTDVLEKISERGRTLWADGNGDKVTDLVLTASRWKIWDYDADGEPDMRFLQIPLGGDLKIVSYRGRTAPIRIMPSWENSPLP